MRLEGFLAAFLAALLATATQAQPLGDMWGTAEAEADYYRVVDLPMPEELAIETGSFELAPDGRLAIGTRRGEIYFVSGAFDRVVCQFGVMFYPDKDRGYAEACRVLRPGGRFVFNVWDSLDHNPLCALIHANCARNKRDRARFALEIFHVNYGA